MTKHGGVLRGRHEFTVAARGVSARREIALLGGATS
jgi:hypothetical protein